MMLKTLSQSEGVAKDSKSKRRLFGRSTDSGSFKEKEKDAEWDPTQEIEQGLVAFQTLLESHVDVAFDFFEAWSMRNIFAVPADLPIVAPHQAGLDLAGAADQPEKESELLAEIDELRRKVHAVSRAWLLTFCFAGFFFASLRGRG